MKKTFVVLLISISLFFASCQTFIGTINSSQGDYEIQYLKDWKAVTKFSQTTENVEAAIIPESGSDFVQIKITSQVKLDIIQGHIREITADYAKKAEKEFPEYKLLENAYIPTEQANGDEKLHLVFTTIASGQAYTVVQDIFALTGRTISVTGIYPESDPTYAKDIIKMMESFKVSYKKK